MGVRIAIGGATGNVGRELLRILLERGFPADELVPLASARSAGSVIHAAGQTLEVRDLFEHDFAGTDILFLSAGAEVSRRISPKAAAAGCVVIDNSSAFRLAGDVPLIVPEVNGDRIGEWQKRRILPVGNCAAIPLAMVLAPLAREVALRRVVMSTYQSVSGAGRAGLEKLARQSRSARYDGRSMSWPDGWGGGEAAPLAFNVVPRIGAFLEDGSTGEEEKVVAETARMLGFDVRMAVTCVRVPVMVGHSASVNIEFASALGAARAREILAAAPGVALLDEPDKDRFAMPLFVEGRDEVFVSRLRDDVSLDSGLSLWIVSDNLRKGAALNAVQIGEALLDDAAFRAHLARRRSSVLRLVSQAA
ncbi:aspartate-semialdehyde dehydrogenase [Paludibacterium paludis]|uniref:Aspartate-semialdehyde dehydrogenase n=1 Tax=Paludibacterium paludis TaxID=1225769 RepID=A0A918P1E5_9NEIS|nr:aspartate-semialdehyde dehydrogenase [Paludibacterium paludis]GGY12011.1 aspartate-semialdehyde dehydrogenase [Paludibacterium paludis]